MEFDWPVFVGLILFGGVVAVDGTSFGQFMISRPLVAATIGGWIVGEPAQGATIGLVLETLHLGVLPVGAAKYPEGGPAAVAAGAVYGAMVPLATPLLVLVIGTLILEYLGGETVHLMRILNGRIHGGELTANGVKGMERRHLVSIGIDFCRGVVLVSIGTVFLTAWAGLLLPFWGLSERVSGLLVVGIVVAMLTSAFRNLGAKYWFAAIGAVIGLVALYLNS